MRSHSKAEHSERELRAELGPESALMCVGEKELKFDEGCAGLQTNVQQKDRTR